MGRRGRLFIVSSPSGGGKTTICDALVKQLTDLRLGITCTTRAPRPGERDGIDYHFIDAAEFDRRVAAGRFAEWAQVHGHRYGTGIEWTQEAPARGEDVVLRIDTQGMEALQRRCPDAVTIFIEPPSLAVLEARLRRRGTEAEATLARRLKRAQDELAAAPRYRYRVVNDDLERAVADVVSIVRRERTSQ
jgi:guanylate kinase